ncbi:LPAR6 protein, partial [Daphoenositta chrysoptera]|nr:LPAR6 protein [Daphoenositta chrysoptera]
MAGISWAGGVSSGTNFPSSNGTNASSGAGWGADWQHSLLAVTYSAVLVLGLAGSALSLSLSLSLLSCRAKPLSHSYILLLQLALLDALLLCLLPLQIHSQLRGDTWAFGDTACRVAGALFCLHSSLSVAFFGCLCADLWLAVLHPLTSIRLRATHYVLLATALWLLALAASVPLALLSTGVRSSTGCFGSFPGSWAHPTAPHTILAFIFGVVVPFSIVLLGLPLVAGSVARSGRRAARRKALGTISIVLGICALCFVPQHLTRLLQFLLGAGLLPREPFLSLVPEMQRASAALASCSCCLNPLLCYFHSSSRPWHCPCRLRPRSKRVFTICDQNFGDPSWDYKPGQRRGRKIHGDGIN